MRQDGSGSLRARLPGTQQNTSDHTEANACFGELPSSHLSDDWWRSIADSLDLSVRQLQIVRCIFDGFDEPTIGHKLGLSSHTIHAHLNRLYKKIRVKSRCELIVRVFLAYLSRAPATMERTNVRARPSILLRPGGRNNSQP